MIYINVIFGSPFFFIQKKVTKLQQILNFHFDDFENLSKQIFRKYRELHDEKYKYSQTICNGDFWLANTLLRKKNNVINEKEELFVKLIDWQFVCYSNCMLDISYMLTTGMNVDTLAHSEVELIQYYYDQLIANGINSSNYTFDHCMEEYKLSKIYAITIYIASWSVFFLNEKHIQDRFFFLWNSVKALLQ